MASDEEIAALSSAIEEQKEALDWLISRVPLREVWGKKIHDSLFDDHKTVDIERVKLNHDKRGPLGGLSSQVELLVRDSGGALNRVVINVYCDENTNASLPREEDMEW